jgi:hypothetical protein
VLPDAGAGGRTLVLSVGGAVGLPQLGHRSDPGASAAPQDVQVDMLTPRLDVLD